MEIYAAALVGYSPLKKLQGGYAFVADENGKSIRSAAAVQKGDRIRAWLADGSLTARVEEIQANRLSEK